MADDFELVAVCDGRGAVVKEVGQQVGVPAFTDIVDVVGATELDLAPS